MKKVVLALGLVAFLFAGGVAIESVNANQTDKVVYDDPPKAEKKSSKSCADYTKASKCCASKSAEMGKTDCKDKEEVKTASVTATNSQETKEASPDKK